MLYLILGGLLRLRLVLRLIKVGARCLFDVFLGCLIWWMVLLMVFVAGYSIVCGLCLFWVCF